MSANVWLDVLKAKLEVPVTRGSLVIGLIIMTFSNLVYFSASDVGNKCDFDALQRRAGSIDRKMDRVLAEMEHLNLLVVSQAQVMRDSKYREARHLYLAKLKTIDSKIDRIDSEFNILCDKVDLLKNILLIAYLFATILFGISSIAPLAARRKKAEN